MAAPLERTDVDVFPLQAIFVLWLAVVGRVTYGYYAEYLLVGREMERVAKSVGSTDALLGKTTVAHLHPTGSETKFLCLILHGDGCYRTVFYPTVVLVIAASNDNRQRSTTDKGTAEVLRLCYLLEDSLILYSYEVPGTARLTRWRHEGGTQYEANGIAINQLFGKLTM